MRRYWLEPEMFHDSEVQITGDIFHHIFEVCRQNLGSRFEVLGQANYAQLVEVTSIGKKSALAKIIQKRELPVPPQPHLILAISISRYPVMDAIIEKAVELGVHSIVPYYSDFSFIRKHQELPSNKFDRWNKIIISATQQSGRGNLMKLSQPVELNQLLHNFNPSSKKMGLFAYEGASTSSIKSEIQKTSKELEELWVFIGSEGGFSQPEVQSFQKMNMEPVSLGDQVLRVETACIALLAILKYELGLNA